MANLWLTGEGEPALAVGTTSDYYRDTLTNIVYYRENNTTWVDVPAFIPNPDGVGTAWLYGASDPLTEVGSNGDYYYQESAPPQNLIYRKEGGVWVLKGSFDFAGIYGVQWGNGTGAPADTEPLNLLPAGSFYLDVSTANIYFKKPDLTWELKGLLGGGSIVVVENELTSDSETNAASVHLASLVLEEARVYADSLVLNTWDDRGVFSAASGHWPSTGGSGTSGAIVKGNLWSINVGGTVTGGIVLAVGDVIRALVNSPMDSSADWAVIQTAYPNSEVITSLQQTADDAGVHARAAALSITLGGADPEIINAIQTSGGYFNFLSTDNLLSGVVRADFQAFDAVTYSRASSALALNNAGVYETFLSNVLRKTNKGVLLEAAATNLVQAPTTLNGTGWSGSGQTLTTGISTPNAATDGTSVTQTGATDSGRNLAFTPAAAGDYQVSMILKKGEIRYTLITYSGGGYGAVQGLSIDWDASGSPAIITAGIGASTATSIETLSNGWYRVKFLMKPTTTAAMTLQLRTTSDGTYANRSLGASAAQIIYNFWHAQIETGTKASSPILTAGTRSADIATITWAGSGQTTDSASVNYTTGQTATTTTLTRANFADSTKFNLISDNGAWLGSYITSIVLTPSQSTAFRTINQRDADAVSTLIAGSISPLVAAVRNVLAANGLGWMSQRFGNRNTIEATDNGATPYLYEDGTLHYWNGHAYGTEAAMLAASNGVRASNVVTFGAYVDTSVDLLGGISFASSVGGFEALSANSVLSFSGGKLINTSTANPNGWRMNLKGFSGKALAFVSNCRRTTAGAFTLAYTKINNNFGGAQIASLGTTAADVTVIGSAGSGTNFWIGGVQSGGGTGITEYNNARLYEAAPSQNFPNGNWTLYLEGVAPASLPSSTEVIAQGDVGVNNDRFRIEYRTDGSVYLVQDSAFGQVGVEQQASVLLGSLTLSSAYKIAVSLNRSEILGGCNGSTGQVDTALATAIAYLRLGRSLAGEAFSGTISKYAVYSLSEKLGWFKRITTLTNPASTIARTPRRLLLNGDSYMANGSTGLGLILDDLGYDSVNLGVGGTTFADQYTAFAAATQYHNFTYIWYDGSPNGHTNGQYAEELTAIQNSIAALGHNRWIYVRSGQISGSVPSTQKADMDALYNKVRELYGDVHVYDPQPRLATLAITDSTNGGYANDQTDIGYGQFPRSLLYDGIHLTAAARRALALEVHKKIEAVRQLV